MRKTAAVLAAAAALSLGACAAAAPVATPAPGTYEVTLEGNGTTGYEWTYAMSEEGIVKETSNASVSEGKEGMVGAPSTYIWDFEALKPGTVTLTYDYARSWEGRSIRTVTYTLTVDDSLQITGKSETAEHVESTEGTGAAEEMTAAAGELAGIEGNTIRFAADPQSSCEWTSFYQSADDQLIVNISNPVCNDSGTSCAFEVSGLKEGRAAIGFIYHKGTDASGIVSQYEFFADVDSGLQVTLSLSAGNSDGDSAPDGSLIAVESDTITVSGNPTTGYDWTPYYGSDADQQIIRVEDYVYTASSTAVGAGGNYAFKVSGLKAGTASFGLRYERSGDAEASSDLKFKAEVSADGTVSISQQIG